MGAQKTSLALRLAGVALIALGLAACSDEGEPMETVSYVDLERFSGDWYVVAGIVTSMEEKAYNPVETYEVAGPGRINTTFTFNKGAFDGKQKTFKPKGFIRNSDTNAEWGMQFFPLVKLDYRIIYLNDEYETTVIGRQKRDLVWIMARTPSIDEAEYAQIVSMLDEVGYDTSKIRQMPHEATSGQG